MIRTDFEALLVDRYEIDAELTDLGLVGPELAHLSDVYLKSPRALVWRNPSPDWRLFVLMLPLASRLSTIANPVFTHLARSWGLNIRFIGVDREQRVFDFRALLSDKSIRLLVNALAHSLHRAEEPTETLDVLFATLAADLLTVIDKRRDDWGRHLLREHDLIPESPHSLFERQTRFPDFLGQLRRGLRDELIDVHFYGKALRSIDLRELAFEQRLAGLIESALDPIVMAKLARTRAAKHLGCYNWLRLDLRHAAARAHVLARLPNFINYLPDALITLETLEVHAGDDDDDDRDVLRDGQATRDHRQMPTLDLRPLAARSESTHSVRWNAVLKRAIDAGQDRAIIEALAQRFAVHDNVIRRLWREQPQPLGTPAAWHLSAILRQLHGLGERQWPTSATAWLELASNAVPSEAL